MGGCTFFVNVMKKLMPAPKMELEAWRKNGKDVEFAWSDVAGICGFWDGNCGQLDVALACGQTCSPMLLDCIPSRRIVYQYLVGILWMLKSVGGRFPCVVHFFVGLHCTRVCRYQAPHPCVDLWVFCGLCVRCCVVTG